MFLEGRDRAVIDGLVARMEKASVALQYEKAAGYRDQIVTLPGAGKQYVSNERETSIYLPVPLTVATPACRYFSSAKAVIWAMRLYPRCG